MPAYKDEKQNTWYCQFYYEDWQGDKKKKKKRSFKTKKEAQEWENSYKLSANANMDMKLGEFVEIYFRDKVGELKERSIKNKRYMMEAHILPYFESKPMNAITPSDIIQWQNARAFVKRCLENHFDGNVIRYQPKRNSFNDFPQREYDFEELEQMLLCN